MDFFRPPEIGQKQHKNGKIDPITIVHKYSKNIVKGKAKENSKNKSIKNPLFRSGFFITS